jgi:acetyltransferase-like isoleucine patch superfamily enzyme
MFYNCLFDCSNYENDHHEFIVEEDRHFEELSDLKEPIHNEEKVVKTENTDHIVKVKSNSFLNLCCFFLVRDDEHLHSDKNIEIITENVIEEKSDIILEHIDEDNKIHIHDEKNDVITEDKDEIV